MFLKNNRTYNLNHRAYFEIDEHDSLLFSASREGAITITDLQTEVQSNLRFGKDIADISFSKSQNIISIIEQATGNLVFLDFQGNLLHVEEPPRFATDYPETIHYGFLACYFDEFEKYFWCAVLTSDLMVEIQLRDVDGRRILDKVQLEDPLGDSHFSFHSTNKPDFVSLWIAAGQDGQEICWLEIIDNRLICKIDSNFSETTPPAFSPDGAKFLVLENYDAIGCYRYPTLKLGSCEWHLDDDDGFAEHIAFTSADYAIVKSNEGRIFLIEVNEMKIVDELIIEDHAPLPEPHYYPNLKGDNLCTNLSRFYKINNNIVFVFNRDTDLKVDDWKDSLIVIPISSILEEIKQINQ
ncbi:MAG TPA: hypothetical protein VIL74_18710 [Pyrinomonadaceae bacterium]|jgi:hypothetical protein